MSRAAPNPGLSPHQAGNGALVPGMLDGASCDEQCLLEDVSSDFVPHVSLHGFQRLLQREAMSGCSHLEPVWGTEDRGGIQ